MSKPVLLSGGNGKVKELVGTTNGQFLVNNGSNDVVFSTATAPTVGQVPVWSGSAWAPGANGSTGTVTSVSTVDTSMGLTLTTTNGTTTPQITLAGTLVVTKGGTNITSYAVGDLLYADTTTSLAKLADVATGNALVSGGVSTAPSWGKIDLTTHVSGTLPVANGGTGATTLTQYGVLVGNTTSVVTVTAAGTAGQYLKSGAGAANPAFATIQASEINGLLGTYAPIASPTFTGTVTIPAGASISGFAPLASPTFTGTPLSTTAAVDTNTTQLATTAYVVGQGYAKLASPTFSGAPSLPTGTTGVTQGAGSNTTALATTAFVTAAVTASSGAPYDVAGEYVGKPPVSTVLMRFIANRSWTLKRTLVQASCTAFPTGSNAVATISVAGSNITLGTITWATTSSTVTIGAFADTAITSGQAVVLTVTTADSGNVFENPFFTLGGVVA